MKDSTKAMIASMFGAVMGYGVGTTFFYFWLRLIAVFIGGIIGWISFAPISLLKTSWSVIMTLSSKIRAIVGFFRDPKNRVGIVSLLRPATNMLSVAQIAGTTITSIFFISTIVDNVHGGGKLMDNISNLHWFYVVSILFGLLGSFFSFTLNLILWHKDFNTARFDMFVDIKGASFTGLSITKELLYFNPITAPFVILYALYKALIMLYMFTLKIVASIPRFLHFLFLVVLETCRKANNNGRMASLFGGAIGTLIGLAFQDPVLGTVIGGVVALTAILIGSLFPDRYMKALWERYRHTYSS